MSFGHVLYQALGLDSEPKDLTVSQVCLRAVLVFIASLIIVRLGHKRFLSKMSAVDVILGFVLASMLARAINGSGPFVPTLIGGLVLVILHRILSGIAFYSPRFGSLIKGNAEILVRDGTADELAMKKHKVSKDDLLEELRLQGSCKELQQVKMATLERSGEISVVKRSG